MADIQVQEQQPLKWPEGWGRTLIKDRKNRSAWKKPFLFYRDQVVAELKRFGAQAVTITKNINDKDPGIAVWFSMKPAEDFSWQTALQIENPVPSLQEIDDAFRRLAKRHHPDAVANGSGGDVQQYLKLQEHKRKARAWILSKDSTDGLDNCIPMDLFGTMQQNMAGIASTLRHLRGLEALGQPSIVERVIERTFRTALPQNASTVTEEKANEHTAPANG